MEKKFNASSNHIVNHIKQFFFIILCSVAGIAYSADDFHTAFFNFNDPETLNPPVTAPDSKQFVSLDGRTFTDENVEIEFSASEFGNTHVRLYKPYDIDGCDVRIYDGEILTVRSLNSNFIINEIQFTMSLSGAATGSNDINFIPSSGEFIWEDEKWIPDSETKGESTVELTSFMQSRLASMEVSLVSVDTSVSVEKIYENVYSSPYYDIFGRAYDFPTTAGIYIHNGKKIIL